MKILVQEYPSSYTFPIIDSFLGAAPDNEKGSQLKTYVQQISEGKKHFDKVVRLEKVEQLEEIVKNSDTLVVNLDEPKHGEDQMEKFLEESVKGGVTSILLFPSETEFLDALLLLRTKTEVQTKQLLFEKKNEDQEVFDENVRFGIICGKLEGVRGTLKVYNGKIENLRSVVSQVTTPGGRISSLADVNKDLLLVHSDSFAGAVSYYGTESQLKLVEKIANKEGFSVSAGKSGEANNSGETKETSVSDGEIDSSGKENCGNETESSDGEMDSSGKENCGNESDSSDPYSAQNIK